MLAIEVHPASLYYNLQDLVHMAFPGEGIRAGLPAHQEASMDITALEQGERLLFSGSIAINGKETTYHQDFPLPVGELNTRSQLIKMARTFTYLLLCRHLEEQLNPYGILTGVRPAKIVHRLLDQGVSEDEIRIRLERQYLFSPAKASLLVAVATYNHAFLPDNAEALEKLSIYIGIPFCPSRCYYCSFPGAIVPDRAQELAPFMEALLIEMNSIGACLARQGWQVQTVYLGGGTPTILNDNYLGKIFEVLYRHYISASTREITIEAGRPDTLTPSRLRRLRQAGVTRICINPQTMHDSTLRLIGRQHNVHMITEAVGWARSAGIKHINMDLIVGLPGENRECFLASAEKVLALNPDNITVHTLAAKRGSLLRETEGPGGSSEQAMLVEGGMNDLHDILQAHEYSPYYLYRQKYMRARLENIGYTLPGHACLYNIQMIEERQTIIGLGGGASSKFVNPADGSLSSIHNPKDPPSYTKRVVELTACKVDKLGALN